MTESKCCRGVESYFCSPELDSLWWDEPDFVLCQADVTWCVMKAVEPGSDVCAANVGPINLNSVTTLADTPCLLHQDPLSWSGWRRNYHWLSLPLVTSPQQILHTDTANSIIVNWPFHPKYQAAGSLETQFKLKSHDFIPLSSLSFIKESFTRRNWASLIFFHLFDSLALPDRQTDACYLMLEQCYTRLCCLVGKNQFSSWNFNRPF